MTSQTGRFLRTALFTSVILAAWSSNAHAAAQEPELYFHPASGWAVQNAEQSCSIASQFNNGFVIGFQGDERWVNTLSVDFRQGVFEKGKSYPVKVSVPGIESKNFTAQSINAQTLDIPLRKQKDFYQAMEKSSVFDLDVEGNSFRFYLTGYAQTAPQFETCMVNLSISSKDKVAATVLPERAGMKNFMVNESIAMEEKTKTGEMLEPMPISEEASATGGLLSTSQNSSLDQMVSKTVQSQESGQGRKRLSEQLAAQLQAQPELIDPSAEKAIERKPLEMPPEMGEMTLTPEPPPAVETAAMPEPMPAPEPQAPMPQEIPKEEPPARVLDITQMDAPEQPAAQGLEKAVQPADGRLLPEDAQKLAAAQLNDVAPESMNAETEVAMLQPAPTPVPETKIIEQQSSPAPKINKTVMSGEADFAAIQTEKEADALRTEVVKLQSQLKELKAENVVLNKELKNTVRDSEEERLSISSDNWNLEQATMKFNEAERQIKRLGIELQQQRAVCAADKKELEAMLFDPQVTSQQQLAKLAALEQELSAAKVELQRLRMLVGSQ